ncbi:hypothetical protein BESB_077930 [Besnoitia besnoiti]|uniref:Uncharacterized protein n=1 Tax=Besnoitia besnoiti TaxID=94643 RepID=A0A2A9MCC3_BESBE|nr:hypothetical protein BESB_077930 [Besnoitia besnoiti]PFH33576.1 hypothetical protein BESB_077930 [Besnoitia besnoiti]
MSPWRTGTVAMRESIGEGGAAEEARYFQGAAEACTDSPNCAFFMLNTDEGKVYLCPENKGFLHASPSSSWTIGVRPSTLQRPDYKVTMNKQAICGSVISQQTVTSIDEAELRARTLGADVFSLNLNRGAATGPSVPSMTVFFCHGASDRARVLCRAGFLTEESQARAGPANPVVGANRHLHGRSKRSAMRILEHRRTLRAKREHPARHGENS